MYCLTVPPFRYQYLLNATKNLISSCSVISKSTMMTPNTYGLDLERKIMDTVLYEGDTVMHLDNYCS
jgi:hypothetical protein